MDSLVLARWQFGITTAYHFLFVPLTLGLSILTAVMQTLYFRTNQELYKKMAKFWGKLFLINFGLGVATGLVQEFQFGMNWSEYARFMGDIFGAPLALEALTAFYLESVFIGVWLFGWDRLSKKVHLLSIWLVAFSSNLSAFWILAANSFMQSPAGYVLRNGRAELTDIKAVLTNDYLFHQYPHTFLAGLVTAGIFVAGISAYHLLKQSQLEFFRSSFRIGLTCALAASLLLGLSGHSQGQFIAKNQPMKMASMEALWETANPAPFAVFASIDQEKQKNSVEVTVPNMLSFLIYDSFTGEVKGLKDLQAQSVQKFGAGDYIPDVAPIFWSFRLMAAAGGWLILILLLSAYYLKTKRLEQTPWLLKAVLFTIPVPYIANTAGWMVAEMGRQPWIVYGLQKVNQAVSPTVTGGEVLTSLLGFTLVYALLAIAGVGLLVKFAKLGPDNIPSDSKAQSTKGAQLWS